MAEKKETTGAPKLSSGVEDIEKSIDSNNAFRKEIVEAAAAELSKNKDEVKKRAIYDLLQEGEYNRAKILLNLRRNRANDDAYKKFLKDFCEVDKDGKIVGGLMAELYAGKHDKESYKKKKRELIEAFSKEKQENDKRWKEYTRKLSDNFPGWLHDWDLEDTRCNY